MLNKLIVLALLLIFLIPITANAQHNLWLGIAAAGADTIVMKSSALDSSISRWIDYHTWRKFEGKASLWSTCFSNGDAMGVSIFISYQLKFNNDNEGYDRITRWTPCDTITAAEATLVGYGVGSQPGVVVSLDLPAHREIRFKYEWTPVALDTAEISAQYNPTENYLKTIK